MYLFSIFSFLFFFFCLFIVVIAVVAAVHNRQHLYRILKIHSYAGTAKSGVSTFVLLRFWQNNRLYCCTQQASKQPTNQWAFVVVAAAAAAATASPTARCLCLLFFGILFSLNETYKRRVVVVCTSIISMYKRMNLWSSTHCLCTNSEGHNHMQLSSVLHTTASQSETIVDRQSSRSAFIPMFALEHFNTHRQMSIPQ